jgi:hypothetical protein
MCEPYVVAARKYIVPAVLEHLRHWWATDALFHRAIRRKDGTICPATVRGIARSYAVSRGLLRDQEVHVARLLDERLLHWPTTLQDRASLVREIAEEAERQGFTKGKQLSAFSKIIWFACPNGWTLYDSFARRGLLSSELGSGNDEYEKYYSRLDGLKFNHAMDLAREVIASSPFPYLWPERIHDKYLMYLGHDQDRGLRVVDVDAHHDLLALWDGFHGPKFSYALMEFAHSFAVSMCDHQAFQSHTLQRGA